MGGRRIIAWDSMNIDTKKDTSKKKKGVWCSLHRCTRKLIDSQWKGIRVERRNRSKDFSLTRGIVFLKGNCFFDGKIPFPPHFPSKSGTCTMMPSHMRKIIWLSLFYACIFCGMWHDVTCPGDVNATFQIWFSLSTTSCFILLIHNPSLSPHQKIPCKNSGPDVTPEPKNTSNPWTWYKYIYSNACMHNSIKLFTKFLFY